MGDIIKPTLIFTATSDEHLRIKDEGAVVAADHLPWKWRCSALTDGRLRADRYYVELQITCSYCDCYVGVVQEGYDVRGDINPNVDSWFIGMAYNGNEVSCNRVCLGEIKPDYRQWRPYTRPHHLGLYLDCDQRSLTVLDCRQDQVMATVRELQVTRPLVPWVQFHMYRNQSASACLVTGDSATLPQVLRDMLNTY